MLKHILKYVGKKKKIYICTEKTKQKNKGCRLPPLASKQ